MHCGDQRHTGLSLSGRPCMNRRRVQGRSQNTTLSASDLHSARAANLNSFYLHGIYNNYGDKIKCEVYRIDSDDWAKSIFLLYEDLQFYVLNTFIIAGKTRWCLFTFGIWYAVWDTRQEVSNLLISGLSLSLKRLCLSNSCRTELFARYCLFKFVLTFVVRHQRCVPCEVSKTPTSCHDDVNFIT